MLRRLGPTHLLIGRAKASGCCCLVGDDLGHRPVVSEHPRLAGRHVSGGGGLLDSSAKHHERGNRLRHPERGRRLRKSCRWRPSRRPSSGRRVSRHQGRAVTPVADCLSPLIAPSLEPMPNRAPGISSGDPQVGQPVRMGGGVGREIDREAGLNRRGRSGAGSRWQQDRRGGRDCG
jgi:hypothetical protein